MNVAELKAKTIRQFALKIEYIDDETALNMVLDFD